MTKLLWNSDLLDGTFQNPVLYADYSDPDVIRVDDTYYMTASSFNYMPGLPILTSKDLVNWELVNYAIKDNLAYPRYETPAHSKGVWAPSIRYFNGEFYIYYGMPDEGIFVVKTKNPLGDWSAPALVLAGKGLIDPCPFIDEDGTFYLIHGYAKSRIGFKSFLGIFRLSADGTKAIDDDLFIYNGTKTQPTIEGPKVYKRNSYYYIFAPAGGVKYGWQMVLRSKNIYGPYEEKIVMHQGSTPINGPHQGAYLTTPYNDEWFLHFQDAGAYGRIAHLQPLTWENDWPIIGVNPNADFIGEPCLVHKKPECGCIVTPTYLEASDDFDSPELSLMWQWPANTNENFYSLTDRHGYLRLNCLNTTDTESPSLWYCANLLTQKIVCPAFSSITKLDYSKLQAKERTGLLIFGGQYAYLAVYKEENGHHVLRYVESEGSDDDKKERILEQVSLPADCSSLYLHMTFDASCHCRMAYSFDGTTYYSFPYSFTPSDHTWVGAKIGIFAVADTLNEQQSYADTLKGQHGYADTLKGQHGYADYEYFHVDALTKSSNNTGKR